MGYDNQFFLRYRVIMTDNRYVSNWGQRLELEFWKNAMRLNTAIPGIINSFDATKQTVSATPGIKAKYIDPENGNVTYLQYPVITNIPLSIIRGAGLSITQPITPGYPCTLIFSQRSIDNFVLEKAVANPVEGNNPMTSIIRCMDLTDAMCFPGIVTAKDIIPNYATDAIEIRSDDGKVKVTVKKDTLTLTQDTATIQIQGGNITMVAGTINITATTALNMTSPASTIDSKDFSTHKHSGVSTGPSNTGGVV